MKILVLGGTGAMGVHLIEQLKKTEMEVFVTSRKFQNSERNINYLQGSAKDLNFIQNILSSKWDVIVDFMVYTTTLFEERSQLLLNATSQYVFLSSARVYADSYAPLKESSSRLLDVSKDFNFLSTDEYALTKARQEDLLMKSGKGNWTIIRPYITYSSDRLQLGVLEKEDWLYRALKGRTIVFSEDMFHKLTTLTFGGDVANGILAILGNQKALGETFHIVKEKSNTWEEILEIYLNIINMKLGFKPKVILQNLEGFLQHHSAKEQVIYDRMYNRCFDNSKISIHLETKKFLEIEEGLTFCLEKFIDKHSFSRIDWRKEARKDKVTKEMASLGEINNIKDKLRYILYRFFKK